MSAHIIGRPNDGLLDIILGDGDGADPEQAIIRGSEQGDGVEDHLPDEEPTVHGAMVPLRRAMAGTKRLRPPIVAG